MLHDGRVEPALERRGECLELRRLRPHLLELARGARRVGLGHGHGEEADGGREKREAPEKSPGRNCRRPHPAKIGRGAPALEVVLDSGLE